MIDTHCHLNHPDFEGDLDAAIDRAVQAGVEAMVVIGYDLPSSRAAVELAGCNARLWATAGIHPHEAGADQSAAVREVGSLARDGRVVAIGEVGLDFYRDHAPPDAQRRLLEDQLDIAVELGLPVVLHTRESTSATLDVLEPYRARSLQAILHCWSGTPEEADRAVAAGWWLGIGGVITYKNAESLRSIAAAAPADRLLLETDSPYLAPQPRRGKRNEPAYLPWVAEQLASVRGVSVEALASQTSANTTAAFPRLRPR